MNEKQLREIIIRPTLHNFWFWSKSAENLLVATSYMETNLGEKLLFNLNSNNRMDFKNGIYGMKHSVCSHIWESFVCLYDNLETSIEQNCGFIEQDHQKEDWLIFNLRFSTIMARLKYLMIKDSLPTFNDAKAIRDYYDDHYNDTFYRDDLCINIFERVCSYDFGFTEDLTTGKPDIKIID